MLLNMTLGQWLAQLERLHGAGILLGLDRIQQAAIKLNLLPLPVPVITVAGTNGKGSVVCALESIYTKAGYQVGSYTSPHLLVFNERIKINTLPVNDEAICAAFTATHAVALEKKLTYFEAITLAALWLFKQQPLDVIILEVGLGGRLDAVNIVDASLCVVTNIDLDHTDRLGCTREAIAQEKAGIFRSKTPVICGDENPPLRLKEIAQILAAPFYCAGKDFYYTQNSQDWTWESPPQRLECLPKNNLLLENMSTALAAVYQMQTQFPVNHVAIHEGLRAAMLTGRQQIQYKKCKHLFDVAHNPAGMQQLFLRVQQEKGDGQVFMVVSMLADKDIAASVQPFAKVVDHWFIAPLAVERAAPIEHLQQALNHIKIPAQQISSFAHLTYAYEAAFTHANAEDLIVIAGSFFTVAQILALDPHKKDPLRESNRSFI